ncbi:Acetyltransferase (GNAT) family protein [Ruminococcaceae bacterium FB2012]|nr:Acetyltransferase (GNAT) family protein [Ruminococcaceae bacterium FB2012]
MEIRYINSSDDLTEISNVYEESWKYAYKGIIPQSYLDSIPKGRWADSITRPGMSNLVMTENGRIIGTAGFCRSRWESRSDHGEIVSIYLLPGYIGKGYGGQLLQRCMDELRKQGFSRLLLWVLEENVRARRFYEKNGFICSEEYMQDNIGGKDLREVMYTC